MIKNVVRFHFFFKPILMCFVSCPDKDRLCCPSFNLYECLSLKDRVRIRSPEHRVQAVEDIVVNDFNGEALF